MVRTIFKGPVFTRVFGMLLSALAVAVPVLNAEEKPLGSFVAVISMEMMILPGTSEYLTHSIERAEREGARALVVQLNTPGGMLSTSQEMIQTIFSSPIPVIFYVSPSGGSATSAGVFLTMAGHVAAMAPGTSIGAAHPVAGDGKDIEGDMRAKAENMAAAMVKSIAEQRGRNIAWAEKSVKESSSLTEREALEQKVVDVVAKDYTDLMVQLEGMSATVNGAPKSFEGISRLPRTDYPMPVRSQVLNVLANPSVVALLWLAATTGLSIELYNPGLIFPGVVGAISLVLALAVSQIIPVSQGAVLLLVVGAALIGLELFIASGVLGIGGVVAIVVGALYLVDVSEAPGLVVNHAFIVSLGLAAGFALLGLVYAVAKTRGKKAVTGSEGMIGQRGKAIDTFTTSGKVFVNGEIWSVTSREGVITKNDDVEVVALRDGFVLEVKKV